MSRRTWLPRAALLLVVVSLVACTDRPTDLASAPITAPVSASRSAANESTLPQLVRALAAARGVVPLERPPEVRRTLVRLGQALTFDRILSGNRDISCSTCHLPDFATGDGRSLSVGQGAKGFGPLRTHPDGTFIPRNAPPLFNLAAMRHLFWDGRVAAGTQGAIISPAGAQLTPKMTKVFEFGPISALGMFPVTNRAEMRSGTGNELAAIPDSNMTGIWSAVMRRLGDIPEYRAMFEAAYPGTRFTDMTFAHASNAIAGFFVSEYSFTDSPWDRFLAGRDEALSMRQLEGAQTFLTLKCSICHTGATFSDEDFHNVAVAQFGPGQGNGPGHRDDFGRMNVTGLEDDRYRFRTTPLRNVELTGPYGHDGAISSLRGFVEHYSESDLKLLAFDPMTLDANLRSSFLNNATAILQQRDTLLAGVVLTTELVDKLMDYMTALTDVAARDLRKAVPAHVPSKLPIDRPIDRR
ncbi:MAG: cytochrome c peroxidase [Gemmatimonadaceae bacterium]